MTTLYRLSLLFVCLSVSSSFRHFAEGWSCEGSGAPEPQDPRKPATVTITRQIFSTMRFVLGRGALESPRPGDHGTGLQTAWGCP